MPVTETGTPGRSSFPVVLVLSLRGHFFEPFPLAIAGLSHPLLTPDNMLLCFVPHVQPGTGTAYWVASYCDRRIQ